MRTEFSAKVKTDALKRCDGKCEGCGAILGLKAKHFDHIIADGLTGEATLENCQVLCVPCHKGKTREDVSAIAEAKRRERRHNGIRKKSRFPGSRDSQWKRTIDGRVVRRNP